MLVTREPGYLLAVAPGQVDLVRFTALAEDGGRALARGEHATAAESLRGALETWRGEPLAEFTAYEFAQPAVARLTELRATATENWFEARLALGDAGSCVPDLERLVEEHPYRERLWSLLVLALYRSRRQADALAALRRVRALLAGELGLEPGPGLRRLEQAVFGQSPDLGGPGPVLLAPAAAPVTAVPPGTLPGPVVHDGLVARREQLGRVAARLAEARRGRGGVLLVAGEAGIGKTRLAEAAAGSVRSRAATPSNCATRWPRSPANAARSASRCRRSPRRTWPPTWPGATCRTRGSPRRCTSALGATPSIWAS
ncbi:BTAD domain-containing putative transcriptional regulator [Microbispora siamensis]